MPISVNAAEQQVLSDTEKQNKSLLNAQGVDKTQKSETITQDSMNTGGSYQPPPPPPDTPTPTVPGGATNYTPAPPVVPPKNFSNTGAPGGNANGQQAAGYWAGQAFQNAYPGYWGATPAPYSGWQWGYAPQNSNYVPTAPVPGPAPFYAQGGIPGVNMPSYGVPSQGNMQSGGNWAAGVAPQNSNYVPTGPNVQMPPAPPSPNADWGGSTPSSNQAEAYVELNNPNAVVNYSGDLGTYDGKLQDFTKALMDMVNSGEITLAMAEKALREAAPAGGAMEYAGGNVGNAPMPTNLADPVWEALSGQVSGATNVAAGDAGAGGGGGGGGGGGNGGGGYDPNAASAETVLPDVPATGSDIGDLMASLVARQPGQIWEMPTSLTALLSRLGMSGRWAQILRAMGFNPIGDMDMYGGWRDWTVPSEFTMSNDAWQLLSGLSDAERVMLSDILGKTLGVGNLGDTGTSDAPAAPAVLPPAPTGELPTGTDVPPPPVPAQG